MNAPQGKCVQCGKPCAPDFTTCSESCNLAYRAGEKPNTYDAIPEGCEVVDTAGAAAILGLSKHTVAGMKRRGQIPRECYYQLSSHKLMFDVEKIKAWRPAPARGFGASYTFSAEEIGPPPPPAGTMTIHGLPSNDAKKPEVPTWPLPDALRDRAIKAAKEAFRDVVLEGADEAKARGDHALRAQFLEDFIFFEEGLQLIYQGRKDPSFSLVTQ